MVPVDFSPTDLGLRSRAMGYGSMVGRWLRGEERPPFVSSSVDPTQIIADALIGFCNIRSSTVEFGGSPVGLRFEVTDVRNLGNHTLLVLLELPR